MGHLGRKQADSLERAAFVSLLRHSGQNSDFDELVDLIEFSEFADNHTVESDHTFLEKITFHKNYASLFKKWQAE
jgi:hypothetical protein